MFYLCGRLGNITLYSLSVMTRRILSYTTVCTDLRKKNEKQLCNFQVEEEESLLLVSLKFKCKDNIEE